MAFIPANRLTAGLLAPLLAGMLSSCASMPPAAMQTTAASARDISLRPASPPEGSPQPAEDICAIYEAMYPASVIQPLESMYDTPRVSTRTEGGNATPAEIRAIRARLVEATGGDESPWSKIPEDMFVRAFRSWRTGPLPDCDWAGFARAVSAPARNGQIDAPLTTDEQGSYTRVSQPFFVDRDTAIVLIREVTAGRRVTRRLVYTYRDRDTWMMLPRSFEDHVTRPE